MSDTLLSEAVQPVEAPLQREGFFLPAWVEVDLLIRAREAREAFKCDGTGTTVAVLDTGLRTTHVDFTGRVAAQRNFTSDNGGDPANAADGQGHGTNVSGIVCASGIHIGVAPGAQIVPVKVLDNSGGGSFAAIRDALDWVLQNRQAHGISTVCMSLGDGGNYDTDRHLTADAIGTRIKKLTAAGVACCIAAGNDYFRHQSRQGMSYPAILRESISVGAVYDNDEGGFSYQSGAEAFSSAADRITPFSQRLHRHTGGDAATDIFAPGAPVTSSGISNDRGVSIQHGTSQATPVVTGVVLLLQSFHLAATGRLPTVEEVRRWLLRGAAGIFDGDDEHDNVQHTGLSFSRVDAVSALNVCARELMATELVRHGVGLTAMSA